MTNQVTIDGKGIGTIDKDPDSVLDYPIRFGNWMTSGDAIDTVEFVGVLGVNVDSFTVEDDSLTPAVTVPAQSMVLAWVSGGDASLDSNQITCRITTDLGRTFDRTLKFKIREF